MNKEYTYSINWLKDRDPKMPAWVGLLFVEMDRAIWLGKSVQFANTAKYGMTHRFFGTIIHDGKMYVYGGYLNNTPVTDIFVTDYNESRARNSWEVVDSLPEGIKATLTCPCCHRTMDA